MKSFDSGVDLVFLMKLGEENPVFQVANIKFGSYFRCDKTTCFGCEDAE